MRVLEFCNPGTSPVVTSGERRRRWAGRRTVVRLGSPRLAWRATECPWLVSLRVHILRQRSAGLVGKTIGRLALEQGETRLDVDVRRIKISCAGVRVKSVTGLVVAGLIKRAKVVPDFRDVRVEADGARIRVQCITVLVDLVVKHTD